MKKILYTVAVMALLGSNAEAAVTQIKICDSKTLTASTTTDCTYADLSGHRYFSFQVYCGETTGDSMSVNIDWVAGSSNTSAYMGIPLLTSTTAMSQLRSTYSTEDAWSVLQTIQPPVAPYGTIRFTENNGDADIVCSVILNMGD